MRHYQHRVEDCRHRPLWRLLAKLGITTTGHGWGGWLNVETGKPKGAFKDRRLRWSLELAGIAAAFGIGGAKAALRRLINGALDPNDVRQNGQEGLCYAPLATKNHCRVGTRDRVLSVREAHPRRLGVRLHSLATRVLFEGRRATGVEYMAGAHLYGADPGATGTPGEIKRVHARREVILAGGAFNTPQLLMLSGIGPEKQLEEHGIGVLHDLPGVGSNLQDRYEVCVQYELKEPWAALKDVRYEAADPVGEQWNRSRKGIYISNGAALAFKRKSDPKLKDADLFMFALLGCFKGYFPGYSRELAAKPKVLSWAVLKARTENRAGTVRLRSSDPRETPLINFHYFAEGTDKKGEDLKAVAKGVEFVRAATDPLVETGLVAGELAPSRGRRGAALDAWIENSAWGHHASCTCPMGDEASGGVLDSRLQVHGVEGLRVVDASIFPRIPGYFIVSAVYMAAEKAAEMILEDAGSLASVAAGRNG